MNNEILSSNVPRSWNVNHSVYPNQASVQELFACQAKQSPHATAVSDGTETIDYRTLNERANGVAATLLRRGLTHEEPVAIVTRRSVDMVVAMLGILKAGGTYLPIDEHCPPERIRLLLSDAGATCALVDDANAARLTGFSITTLRVRDIEVVLENPAITSGPLHRAYIMYTSGSTGTPKGVAVLDRGIVRLVRNTNYVAFTPSDVVAQVANPAFDAITFEVWGALLNGARLEILPTDRILSPHRFAAELADKNITIMFLTASLFSVMASTVPGAFGRMRYLLAGGDAVNPAAARAVLRTAPPYRLVNGYGPTECTTFSVCHTIETADETTPIPIGRPISNSEAYILDEQRLPVPAGEAGELYLGGDGLARGYLNRPELTAERFIPHPFDSTPGARLYKTGDRARFLPDGVIEFLGRQDHQIKFHGYRIELGEIEAALRKHPQVIDAVVLVVRPSAHDDRLAAWVASKTGITEQELRTFLAASLPHYMIPAHIATLQNLPVNAVGKVDRNRLQLPAVTVTQPSSAPLTDLENRILAIWKEILSLSSVDLDDNFFDAGGSSITLALVEHRLRNITDKSFTITDLFRYTTIRSLAQFLTAPDNTEADVLLADSQRRAARQRAVFGMKRPKPFMQNSR